MKPLQFIERYQAALATQQWDSVAPLIHEDACITFSTGVVNNGIDAIKEAYERNFSLIKSEEYSIKEVRWIFTNASIATYSFDFYWEGLINGQLLSGKGRGTTTLIKEKEMWLLITEHLGTMPG